MGMVGSGYGSSEVCTNPDRQVVAENNISRVASNTCGTSGWKLFRVTFKAHRILRWLLEFGKFVYP